MSGSDGRVVTYLDTGILMTMLDKTDKGRRNFKWGNKEAEAIIRIYEGKQSIWIPMPAISETFFKLSENHHDNQSLVVSMYQHFLDLVNQKKISIAHIEPEASEEIYSLASRIISKSYSVEYSLDSISPMDALIMAVAICNLSCNKFVTKDKNLLFNQDLYDIVVEKRKGRNSLNITDAL